MGEPTTRETDTAPVRPGEDLDWPRVEAYLRERLPELSGEFAVLQFPNGSANLTYQIRFGDTALVLRRPPFGRIAPGAHDMGREYKVLSRLWKAYPRAPKAQLLCTDHAVAGADFLVVEYRSGVVVWDSVPASMSALPAAGRRVGLAVIDALADLHRVDPVECGLADLGRPVGFLERQVRGWRKRWELAAAEGGDPLAATLGERLAQTLPASGAAAIVHNDFKIDNCQFAPGDPDEVVSVFDWDMATLGDPLVDLGTLLNYWPDPEFGDAGALASLRLSKLGLPSREELVERYAARSGIDVGRIDWYEAYGCFKTAVILQQLYARYLRGETTDERMAARGEHIPVLVRRGLTRLAGDA
ncbi:phosphotransferase family protein [Amycolatopsis endophytica]|uniref:Aminoglycoside phosphotransferase (APT) family kinase protein n=1 Tax=Amycolatopsis endophytica TaxID=860233 RepID=A0A853BA59_9PSEU|nr:phosphotransferase family protein [Amycolatopsis endophytica]NYI92253.1 aminoglycoside phosphotransferase (APT) family kinase protein [Amycolatopsis endophytica]